jgi:hypothetical protein
MQNMINQNQTKILQTILIVITYSYFLYLLIFSRESLSFFATLIFIDYFLVFFPFFLYKLKDLLERKKDKVFLQDLIAGIILFAFFVLIFISLLVLTNSLANQNLIDVISSQWYFIIILMVKNIILALNKQKLYDYTQVLFIRIFAVMIILIIIGRIIGFLLDILEISDQFGKIIIYVVVGIIFLINLYFDYLIIKTKE